MAPDNMHQDWRGGTRRAKKGVHYSWRVPSGLVMVTPAVRRQPLTSCLFQRGDVLLDHDNLEEFSDAINYDREDSSDTGVAFYQALAQEAGGPVLEIACGTGRVTIPIAKLGFPVTGLDLVPGMLEQ